MNFLAILLPPILGGIIALSTNWIAIKMLFRPHKEIRLFGIRMPFTPGLIPKERSRLARKLGEAISTHLLTPDVLAGKLSDPSVWPLPDCTVGEVLEGWGIANPVEYISTTISTPAKKAADTLLPKAIQGIMNLPEKFPALDSKLAELTSQVAEKSISSFAGLFVKRDKIYNNIKSAIFGYLSDPDNQEVLRGAIHNAIDSALAADAQEAPTSQQDTETLGAALATLIHTDDSAAKLKLCERICAFHIREGAQMLFQREPYASIIRRIFEVLAAYLATHMPIADMIEQKMSGLDVAETERVLLSVVGRELRLIILLGGLFGFLIGLLSLVMQLM